MGHIQRFGKLMATVAVAAGGWAAASTTAGAAPTASVRPAAVACSTYRANNTLPLRPCDKGDLVKEAQRLLNRALGNRVDVDGMFGPSTQAAIADFQRINHLQIDNGTIGSWTMTSLRSYDVRCASYRATNDIPLAPCSKGLATAYIQVMLKRLVAPSMTVDGMYGQQTTTAVRRFEAMIGFKADGTVGTRTLPALIWIYNSVTR